MASLLEGILSVTPSGMHVNIARLNEKYRKKKKTLEGEGQPVLTPVTLRLPVGQ